MWSPTAAPGGSRASAAASGASPGASAGSGGAVRAENGAAFDLLFPRRPAPSSRSSQAQRRALPPPPAFEKQDPWTFVTEDGAVSEPSGKLLGVIGSSAASSGTSSARLVWNRVAPEEEEREEEALPSYLSYAASAFLPAPVPATASFASLQADETAAEVEDKTRELARALQDFVLARVGPQNAGASAAPPARSHCDCGALRSRVDELEASVRALQEAAKEDPVTAVSDRISTLEGRQSAFQSQLAQIARVLGVPVGKSGKNSPLKTLVQSLHEEIDRKLEHLEARLLDKAEPAAEDLAQDDSECASTASASSALPMDAVLGALAGEHEAAMSKLTAATEERVLHESKQRVALEARVQARLAQQEEWLLQLERELSGTRYDQPNVDVQVSRRVADLEAVDTEVRSGIQQLQSLVKQLQTEHKSEIGTLRESVALSETLALSARDETHALAKTSAGLKILIEKLVRDTGAAEELLQRYVSTITHQVASVTRQYVAVRIRDNNRLLDAALRARVPDYAASDGDRFPLVRSEGVDEADDADGMRSALLQATAAPGSKRPT